MKNPNVKATPDNPAERAPPCDELSDLPNLWDHMTAVSYDDGSPREVSTLTVFVEGRIVKVCLNDRAVSRSLFTSGASIKECLESVEKALRSDAGADWRPWKTKKK